jgi:Protein of unknown function (DUF1360)
MTDPPWYGFVLGVLAVWRVAHFLHVEHGPWGLLTRLRGQASEAGLGELFECFYCLSFWVAAPAAWWLAASWQDGVVTWLALSAGAIFLEVRGVATPPPVADEEDHHDMLR